MTVFNTVFKGASQRLSGPALMFIWFWVVVASAAINIYLAQGHAEEVARAQARTMFEHIVLTRSWNALHGGVYVPITESTQPNPYLKVPERDVSTEKGTKLTKINPAYMTRQVGELAMESDGVQFHITSLNPIRPKNAATSWERAALERFELGEKESGEFLYEEHKYRYMAPLITTKGCLKCHEEQGYKVGDIRGGISVTQPVEELLHNREHGIANTIIAHAIVLIVSFLAMVFYGRSQRGMQKLLVDKESADQANEFKGAFIANISHELRTPLNAIIGMSHILSGETLKPAQRENVQRISEAGMQLNSMVNQMLDFSQLDAGSLELTATPFHLRQVVQECFDIMREKAEKKGITFTVDFPEGFTEYLSGDAQHIQNILVHIIDNAIKFTDSGGVQLTVTATSEDGVHYDIVLVVEDSGIGMEKSSDWLQMHEFAQAADYRTRRQGGVGMGLTLSRRLLALMGGSLHIESEEGVGTRVTIRLMLERAEKPVRETGKGEPVQEPILEKMEMEEAMPARRYSLDRGQRQQLTEQLSQLLASLESDLPRAMELLAEMIEQYEGCEFQAELEMLSEKMAAFDIDGALELGHSLHERLSQD